MSNKKQTAVEWLVNKLKENCASNLDWGTPQTEMLISNSTLELLINEAKELEKQQMKLIFIDSRKIDCECDIWNCKGDAKKYESFEQYYNETYENYST